MMIIYLLSFFAKVEWDDAAWKAAEQVGESRFGSRDDLVVSQHGAACASVRACAADPLVLCGFDRALKKINEKRVFEMTTKMFYNFRKWP
jgi:hypothetical protein